MGMAVSGDGWGWGWVQMGTVGDGDKFDGYGWGWGQTPVPVQLSNPYSIRHAVYKLHYSLISQFIPETHSTLQSLQHPSCCLQATLQSYISVHLGHYLGFCSILSFTWQSSCTFATSYFYYLLVGLLLVNDLTSFIANIKTQVNKYLVRNFPFIFSTRQHMLSVLYAIANPSICLSVWPSHGWISRKRLKLGSCNFHRTVAPFL